MTNTHWTTRWSGRTVEKARALIGSKLPLPCGKCGGIVEFEDDWIVGHIKSRAAYPELTLDPTNWCAEHRPCSDESGHEAMLERISREQSGEAPTPVDPERSVILISGPPAAGKTTEARRLEADGYQVFDRDEQRWENENHFLEHLARIRTQVTKAAVIRSAPTQAVRDKWAKFIGATETRVIDPGEAETLSRARRRGRDVAAKISAIRAWYQTYRDDQNKLDAAQLLEDNGMLPIPLMNPQLIPADMEMNIRPGLTWDPEYLLQFEWLAEFATVPEDAAPPLYMTPVHPDAVGSYGHDIIEWAEAEHGVRLRWWQRLSIVRQLEHRADGTLCYRSVIDSAPRRAGKSVKMRLTALWRLEFGPEVFGETQLVIHTGSDIPICREIQRGAWRWAERRWGSKSVTKANGKEAIETPFGSRWLVRSQDGVYGYDTTYGMVDEGWDVKVDTVSEGIEPATLERSSPQTHLTSTAHRRATSLMKTAIKDALTIEDPETLLLIWAAPAGSDPSDPKVWQAASPHWSEDRRKLIAAKYTKALAGEADPQADDPDPMKGFISQYLNVWDLKIKERVIGDELTEAETWNKLHADREQSHLISAAIESWFGEGVAVTLCYPGDVPHAVTRDYPNLEQAVATILTHDSSCKVTVGASLLEDPAVKLLGRRTVKGQGRVAAAATELKRLIKDQAFTHDGSDFLDGQVLDLRTQTTADGPRIVSKGRADAVKTITWAVAAAQQPARKKARLVTL